MRFESPLQQYRVNEEEGDDDDEIANEEGNEGRRITILPMAGTAVGTTIMTTRVSKGLTTNRNMMRMTKFVLFVFLRCHIPFEFCIFY